MFLITNKLDLKEETRSTICFIKLGRNYANVNEPEGYLLTRPNKVKTKTQIISLFVVYPCQMHKGRGGGGGRRHNTQHNDIQHNGLFCITQNKGIVLQQTVQTDTKLN
jgi:hypothetical protein